MYGLRMLRLVEKHLPHDPGTGLTKSTSKTQTMMISYTLKSKQGIIVLLLLIVPVTSGS